jgi:hypothetical protein
MTAVTDIPVNPDDTYDEPTWGESGGPFAVPAEEAAGLGSVILPSGTVNYEWQHLARWIRAMGISRMVPSSAGLFGTFVFPTSGAWTTGAGLSSSITASWVMVDANDDGGVVVQFTVAIGSPHAFTASKDTYVNLNEAGLVAYQEVNNGAGAPVPAAGYVAIWKIETDGANVTAATVLVPEIPTHKSIGAEELTVSGQTNFTDLVTITVPADAALIVTGAPLVGELASVLIGANGGPALSVANNSATDTTATFHNDFGGPGIVLETIGGDVHFGENVNIDQAMVANSVLGYNGVYSSTVVHAAGNISTDAYLNVTYSGSFGYNVIVGGNVISTVGISTDGYLTAGHDVSLCIGSGAFTCTIGTSTADTFDCLAAATIAALTVTGATALNGSSTLGNAAGDIIAVIGTMSCSEPFTGNGGLVGVGTGAGVNGVLGTGFNNATSYGVKGVAVNTGAVGVVGTSSAAATSSGVGIAALGLGDANALYALSVDGNAAKLETDATAPKRSPLVVVPVDSDPTTTQAGSLFLNSSRVKWRTHNGAAYESIHSSTKGWVHGDGTTTDGSNVGTTGDVADAVITPEVTGVVLVEVTGMWNGRTDTTTMTILLKDVTGSVTVATSQPLNSLDIDGAGTTGRMMPFTFRKKYTLPTAAQRTFRVRLDFSATVDWYDIVLTVKGVY